MSDEQFNAATGTLRFDPGAPEPWRYRGALLLPAGRTLVIEGAVATDAAGKHFILRGGLQPGMTLAEIEAALVECEAEQAERIRRAGRAIEDMPIDELPF